MAAEQQGAYAGTIVEHGSSFAAKVKKRGSWRAAGCSDEELDNMTKPLRDHNVAHHRFKKSPERGATRN